MPPPVHQTFQGQNFVICSFCPRELDYDPEAIALPYHHSNVQSEEAIYYVDGQFGSRKGVDVGMITLHPSGLPHGPQPGLVEASLGARRTEELAVMWDTFRPLKLSRALARTSTSRTTRCRGSSPRPSPRRPPRADDVRGGTALLAGHPRRGRRRHRPPGRRAPRRQRPRVPRAPQRHRRGRARLERGRAGPADRLHRGRAGGLADGLARARAEARALRVPGLPRGGRGARPPARAHPAARRDHRPTAAR